MKCSKKWLQLLQVSKVGLPLVAANDVISLPGVLSSKNQYKLSHKFQIDMSEVFDSIKTAVKFRVMSGDIKI